MAAQAGLELDDTPSNFKGPGISTSKLEAHYLSGGDVTNVIMAMIAASRAKVDLGFSEACTLDLSGHDVLEEMRRRVYPDSINQPGAPSAGKPRA